MLIKFHNHGTGPSKHATNYLLGENNDRENARILSGDREITELLIDSINRKSKYKSGVLSFEERADELTESQKLEIMREFEKVLFPGLAPDQYDILWVEHADKDIDENNKVGRLELNFLIPTVELRSGKRLQPYWSGQDNKRVNAFKNITNIKYNLSEPDDPSRKRLINHYDKFGKRDEQQLSIKNATTRAELRTAINNEMDKAFEMNLLNKRQSVIHHLKSLGLNVEPIRSKKTITVTSDNVVDKNNKPLKVRLDGDLYKHDFDATNHVQHLKQMKHKAYNSQSAIQTRLETAQRTLDRGMQLKTAYNRELYDIEPPAPLELAVTHVDLVNDAVQSQTAQTAVEPKPVPDNMPGLDF